MLATMQTMCNAHLQLIRNVGNAADYGWKLFNNCYTYHWFDGDAMPSTINEIVINDEEIEEDTDHPTNNEQSKFKP